MEWQLHICSGKQNWLSKFSGGESIVILSDPKCFISLFSIKTHNCPFHIALYLIYALLGNCQRESSSHGILAEHLLKHNTYIWYNVFFMNFRSMTWLNKACWVEWINLSCMFPDFSEARVEVRDGLSVFTVPLPSRRENCEFTLKPVSQTVGDLLNYMTKEDGGIDRAAVYTDGKSKGARSTPHTLRMRGWMKGVKFIG